MNSQTTISIPTPSDEAFEALPESIRFSIRYLETRVQKLEARVHELEEQLSKDSSNMRNRGLIFIFQMPPTKEGVSELLLVT